MAIVRLSVLDQSPIRSGGTAAQALAESIELARIKQRRQHAICGTPERVRERLQALVQQHEADELVVISNCHDFAVRKRFYSLLAQAFNLKQRGRDSGIQLERLRARSAMSSSADR